MKRSAEREMGTPLKRARSTGHELRILIPSRNAGSIIGKGGSNISRLRTENKATISVPDCPGPERLITIAADDQDVSFNVLSEVVPLLEEAGNKSDQRSSRSGSDGGTGGAEIRILLHHSQVGCVIGKGGGKIKELRESSGAQIKVYGSCCPRSTDRVVAITGSSDVVLNAVKQIVGLVSESPIKGMSEQYDPHNYDEMYAAQYGGYGEARGGVDRYGDRSYRSVGGSRGGDRMSGSSRGDRGGGGGGRGDSRGYRNGGGRDSGRREHRSGGSNGVRGGGGDGYMERDRDDYGDAERTTNQVTIPKEYAGAIIGKGGSRIRRIRADSGASITIDEALPGASDRIITISGAPGQIRMAQYLLQQSVKDHGELKEH